MRNGIKSIETAFQVLRQLSAQPMTLSELATALGHSKSYVHHYMATLSEIGAVARRGSDQRYALGSTLIELGTVALRQYDVLECCEPFLTELQEAIGESVSLATWGDGGPLFLAVKEEYNHSFRLGVRVGARVPLEKSATGAIFRAHPPYDRMARIYPEAEEEVSLSAHFVREYGYAVAHGTFYPGISSVAVPFFGANRELAGAITVLTTSDCVDQRQDELVAAMVQSANKMSHALGVPDGMLESLTRS